MRESVVDKTNRLLIAGAITIELHAHDITRANVIGDHSDYIVTRDQHGWRCTCPARRGCCAHVAAVQRVTGDQLVANDTPGHRPPRIMQTRA